MGFFVVKGSSFLSAMSKWSASLTGRHPVKKQQDIARTNVENPRVTSSTSLPKQRAARKRAVTIKQMTGRRAPVARPVKDGRSGGVTSRPSSVNSKIPKAAVKANRLQKNRLENEPPSRIIRRTANVKPEVKKTTRPREQPSLQEERPRRILEKIKSTPEQPKRRNSVTAITTKLPVKDRKKVTSDSLERISTRASRNVVRSTSNKPHCSPIASQGHTKPVIIRTCTTMKTPKSHPKNVHPRAVDANKERKSRNTQATKKLLEGGCQSKHSDIDANNDTEGTKKSRSDFIDHCLTFSKECDEATGRADRLLEELSFMRCRSRCASKKSALPSWTKTKTSLEYQHELKKSVRKIVKGVNINPSPSRETMMDSPMETVQRNNKYCFQGVWHPSPVTDDDELTNCGGHESSSSDSDGTPSLSPWMKELAEKSTTKLGTPFHEELKICLERMAALELENRALKELLVLKCGVVNDAGIGKLPHTTLKSEKDLQSPNSR